MTNIQYKIVYVVATLAVVLHLPPVLNAQTKDSRAILDDLILEQFLTPLDVPRLALVVGAEHYENLPTVPNALNDARGVARELVDLGFPFVRLVEDPKDDNEIYDYMKELAQRAGDESKPAIIFFFFAGHGFQDETTNYIVPLNAAQKARGYSVPVTTILEELAKHDHGLAIFVFDSCRSVLRSEGKGFAKNQAAPNRAVVGLAAGYDQTASSGLDSRAVDSPYTYTLLYFMNQEGMPLTVMFGKVSDHVNDMTKATQTPEVIGAGKNGYGFFFRPGAKVLTDELELWKAALKTSRVSCIRNYHNAHPGSAYLAAAANWLAEPSHPDTAADELGTCPED